MLATEIEILDHPEVLVSQCDRITGGCLVFRFKGKLTVSGAKKAVEAWSTFQDENPQSELIHIWNCSHMSGFEVAAKSIWMNQMEELSDTIKRIIIVSDNIVIRGAARLMSKFIKQELQAYKNEEEMEQNEK